LGVRRPLKTRARSRRPGITKTRLRELIEEAIVDAYGESEQIGGLYTAIEEHLAVPFETTLLGMPVTIRGVDLTERDEIVAICSRGRFRQTIQSWTWCCRRRHLPGPSGSRLTAAGLAGADGGAAGLPSGAPRAAA
jgi:transposase